MGWLLLLDHIFLPQRLIKKIVCPRHCLDRRVPGIVDSMNHTAQESVDDLFVEQVVQSNPQLSGKN